ncbi:hypothetical protein [Phenylobacterium aquaticum]|uniref:hypothetical protein n=1 Tax=Phenylobacterium aquaticum TaxID=1763816 RepID=UPI001F5DA0BC|nr:hypothetical protein [Phenylobacterium aquaticum]MCI3133833.1 hypothetical protein [Phenylobacterium aquaticum]
MMNRAQTIWAMAGLYAALTFAAGVLMGAVRVMLIAPLAGAVAAVMLELPIMLAVSWLICGWILDRPWAFRRFLDRAAMGVAAFALMMALEMTMALTIFGQSPAAVLKGLAAPAGVLGLAGQAAFAMLPLAWRLPQSVRAPDAERRTTYPAAWPHLDS